MSSLFVSTEHSLLSSASDEHSSPDSFQPIEGGSPDISRGDVRKNASIFTFLVFSSNQQMGALACLDPRFRYHYFLDTIEYTHQNRFRNESSAELKALTIMLTDMLTGDGNPALYPTPSCEGKAFTLVKPGRLHSWEKACSIFVGDIA